MTRYDADGELLGKTEMKYDKNGNVTTRAEYDADDELVSEVEYEDYVVIYLAAYAG